MKRTDNPQINTRTYWNYIYTTPAKKQEYWDSTSRFRELMKYVKKGEKLLDLGCGVGLAGRYAKDQKDCEVWGVDISDEIIEANKKDCPKGKWFQGYIGNTDFLPKNYFDIVFCGEVIEHLDDPNVLFKEAHKFLKKGGRLVITTPKSDGVESSEHVWYFVQNDIEDFFHNSGFKTVKFIKLPDMEHLMIFFVIGIK